MKTLLDTSDIVGAQVRRSRVRNLAENNTFDYSDVNKSKRLLYHPPNPYNYSIAKTTMQRLKYVSSPFTANTYCPFSPMNIDFHKARDILRKR